MIRPAIIAVAVLALLCSTSEASATNEESCLPASIRQALVTVRAACLGVKVGSTNRPGAVIEGTNHASMHAACRAADFKSTDYGCVLRVLKDWPGKLSIDPGIVHHIHIDDGRYARFKHGVHNYAAARRSNRRGRATEAPTRVVRHPDE